MVYLVKYSEMNCPVDMDIYSSRKRAIKTLRNQYKDTDYTFTDFITDYHVRCKETGEIIASITSKLIH